MTQPAFYAAQMCRARLRPARFTASARKSGSIFGKHDASSQKVKRIETRDMGLVTQRQVRGGCVVLRKVIDILRDFLRLTLFQPYENADDQGGRRRDD
jgi:hypothetical protein